MTVSRSGPAKRSLERHRPELVPRHAAELDARVATFRQEVQTWDERSMRLALATLGDAFERFDHEGAERARQLELAGELLQGTPDENAIRQQEDRLRYLRRHPDNFMEAHGERVVRIEALELELEALELARSSDAAESTRAIAEVLRPYGDLIGEDRVARIVAHGGTLAAEISAQPDEVLVAWRDGCRRQQPLRRLEALATVVPRGRETQRARLDQRARDLDFQAQQLEDTEWRPGQAQVWRIQAEAARSQIQFLGEAGTEAIDDWMHDYGHVTAVMVQVDARLEQRALDRSQGSGARQGPRARQGQAERETQVGQAEQVETETERGGSGYDI